MEKDQICWIISQLDEARLQNMCKNIKIKIPGFRSILKCPKPVMVSNLSKNINEVFNYLKLLADKAEEKKELEDKDITEIELLLDMNNKEKIIEQIIYLVTRDETKYINLANKIINMIKEKDITKSEIIIDEDKDNDDVHESSINDLRESNSVREINNNELIKSNDEKSNKIQENKDDNMNDIETTNKYIVRVEEKKGFHNIYPLYRIEDGSLIKIDRSEYPDYGNINVNPWLEFENKKYDIKCPLWICRFNETDLTENLSKAKNDSGIRTKFKIDGNKLIEKDDIYDINNEGIYEIAELDNEYATLDELIHDEEIEIKNKPIKEKFYIKDNKFIYGPFGYIENNRRGVYYIDKKNSDYIVDKYPIEDNKENLNILEIYNEYDHNNNYIKAVYFYNKEHLISEKIDTISDEKLIDKLKQTINIKNTSFSKEEIENIRKNINSIINNNFPEDRKKRIEDLITNTEKNEDFINLHLVDIINLLLDDENTRKTISSKIIVQNDILAKLQNIELVQEKLESYNIKIEKAQQELDQIQLQIKNANSKNKEKVMEEMKSELKDLEEQQEKVKKNINELTEKYNLCNEIDKLISQKEKIILQKEKIEKEAIQAREDYNTFNRHKGSIQEEIEQKLSNITSTKNLSDVAFDGIIANEILESAAKWSKKRHVESFENLIASKNHVSKSLKVKSFENDNLIDYIYKKFKRFRNYSKNDVINMMICINQGFLTVFAGEPGVGKTSACNIIANILGLSNPYSDFNRFTEISVENGWTSKRDLIGYYNPLTKSFDKNNGELFKTFNILNHEYKKDINDFPYYILLDEANLSSMEHYWADFMNVCDFSKNNRMINLGEDYVYNIPKTLRFLATINYDHTTETLSPRLIDRAWIILLEAREYNLNLDDEGQCEQNQEDIILFEDLQRNFNFPYIKKEDDFSNKMEDELREIYRKFNENNIAISPRVDNMMQRYLNVGCILFEKTENTLSREFVALDYAVAQKLLPKINGYGENYRNFLEDIEKYFVKNNMVKCKSIISNIIKKGDTNMQYYQFFS